MLCRYLFFRLSSPRSHLPSPLSPPPFLFLCLPLCLSSGQFLSLFLRLVFCLLPSVLRILPPLPFPLCLSPRLPRCPLPLPLPFNFAFAFPFADPFPYSPCPLLTFSSAFFCGFPSAFPLALFFALSIVFAFSFPFPLAAPFSFTYPPPLLPLPFSLLPFPFAFPLAISFGFSFAFSFVYHCASSVALSFSFAFPFHLSIRRLLRATHQP